MTYSPALSILMPVYKGDHPGHFREALQSLVEQTQPAEELLIVADGPLTENLEAVLREYQAQHSSIRVHRLDKNGGLSRALNVGLKEVSHDWVARMDADDICTAERLEKQRSYLRQHPELSILGSWIAEFAHSSSEVRAIRKLPEKHDALLRYARWRCPFNHMTVLYKASAVRSVGGYKNYGAVGDDYELWARLLIFGYRAANIQEALVYARASEDFFGKRRRGLKYLRNEWREVGDLYRLGLLGPGHLIFHLAVKTLVRLSPPWLVRFFYRLIRKTS